MHWKRLTTCLLFAQVAASTLASESVARAYPLMEPAAGIYVRQGHHGVIFEDSNIANIGAIVGSKCVAVIDTGGSRSEGQELRKAIEALTSTPICYVINTHGHPDHFLGNAAFADLDNVEFIAHSKLPDSVQPAKLTWLTRLSDQQNTPTSDADWFMPTTLIDEKTSVDLGDRVIEITPLQTAHSQSDLIIYDRASDTLWLSDILFVEHTPVLTGSITQWINTLTELRSQNHQHLIPGHGSILDSGSDAIERNLTYLKTLQRIALEKINDGESLFDAQQHIDKKRYSDHWVLFEQYQRRNISRAWSELEWLN